ncbi:TPA: hypothetical protein N0F65_006314 [Lagenidium giganteum]|uniref:Ankyrin n=1 Tax=Lagenidium giganteum TaxID=4803 RepID=A0AAV2YPW9_9STRA|nr:TPA: hypothetical protein N0F65_006314 [Lagenidium giganteum]
MHFKQRDIVRYEIEEAGEHPNDRMASAEVPLRKYARASDIEMMQLPIDHGADVGVRNQIERTPLMLASNRKLIDTAELLLQSGANVNDVTVQGNTALHFAARAGSLDMVKLLVTYGASVDNPINDVNTDEGL